MSGQGDLLDARVLTAQHFLALSLWAELCGHGLRAFQFAKDANTIWGAVHGR